MSEMEPLPKWGRFGDKNKKAAGSKPSKRTSAARPEGGQRQFIITAALVVLLLVGAAFAMNYYRALRPDPHYTAATKMIGNYESSRAPERRNYGHQVYGTALDELAMVAPESISADDAQRLDHEIRRKMVAFQARLRQDQRQQELTIQARREKQEISYQLRLEARANPRTYFPECEDEEGGDHSHGDHKH